LQNLDDASLVALLLRSDGDIMDAHLELSTSETSSLASNLSILQLTLGDLDLRSSTGGSLDVHGLLEETTSKELRVLGNISTSVAIARDLQVRRNVDVNVSLVSADSEDSIGTVGSKEFIVGTLLDNPTSLAQVKWLVLIKLDGLSVQGNSGRREELSNVSTVEQNSHTNGSSVTSKALVALVDSKDTIRSLGHQEITFELKLKILTVEASGVRIQVRNTLSHGVLANLLDALAYNGLLGLLVLNNVTCRALEGSSELILALDLLASSDKLLLDADSLVLQADGAANEAFALGLLNLAGCALCNVLAALEATFGASITDNLGTDTAFLDDTLVDDLVLGTAVGSLRFDAGEFGFDTFSDLSALCASYHASFSNKDIGQSKKQN
jgi:hypothetical protein